MKLMQKAMILVSMATLISGPALAAEEITDVNVVTHTPAALMYGTRVTITCNYETQSIDGVRIFFRPYTNGSPTPGYGAHGSPLYAYGHGSAEGWFTINSGEVTVDQIRVTMLFDDQSFLLKEVFVPVTFHYNPSVEITKIDFNPLSPANLITGEDITAKFDYDTTSGPAGGTRIFFRPFTGNQLSLNYGAHGSPSYEAGTGSGSGSFTIYENLETVDRVRVSVWNNDQTAKVTEFFIPVNYTFSGTVAVQPTTWGKLKAAY